MKILDIIINFFMTLFSTKKKYNQLLKVNERLEKIAEDAISRLEHTSKTVKYTTLMAYDEGDSRYLDFLQKLGKNPMFLFYAHVKKDQILDMMFNEQANAMDLNKERYISWIEGIDFLLDGTKNLQFPGVEE